VTTTGAQPLRWEGKKGTAKVFSQSCGVRADEGAPALPSLKHDIYDK